MENNKINLQLNAYLVKKEYNNLDFVKFIKSDSSVKKYELNDQDGLEGVFFVKKTSEKKPVWNELAEKLINQPLDELKNKSSSAVLLVKNQDAVIAFIFGYGRYLIDTKYFVQDFGIKTALNTLNHNSLRSVELYTFDDQAVQKKSQASKESGISVFGIDISKDVLHAVTGSPKKGVKFKNISGGDAVYSFKSKIDINDISNLLTQLTTYYNNDSYKNGFSWVDNIRKIKDKSLIDSHDDALIKNIKENSANIMITIPEIVQWDTIYGFSFKRTKKTIRPTIEAQEYFNGLDVSTINIDSIKRDRLFVFDLNKNESDYPMYKCIYFEYKKEDKTYILFASQWYEIDSKFINRINQILNKIKISNLSFPPINVWEEDNKLKIESEGDYNQRASDLLGYHLLDKRLIKSNRVTTSIELCDLLTIKKQFIHVKHRKGGSSGLSHLFSQGSVSAELLLSDREFRIATCALLENVSPLLKDIIPIDTFRSDEIEIIFLILGEDSKTLKDNLPFFSKVNLSKTYENLTQKGFKITIAGADKVQLA